MRTWDDQYGYLAALEGEGATSLEDLMERFRDLARGEEDDEEVLDADWEEEWDDEDGPLDPDPDDL